MDEWEIPTAEINRRRHRRHDNHRRILSHEEERPAHPGVFSVKSCDQLRLSFRQIKRRAIVFGDAADQKH